MKKVYLHGSLGKRFGRKFELHAKNLPEIMIALESNNEGFIKYVIDAKKEGQEYAVFTKDPAKIKSQEELDNSVFHKEYMDLNFKKEELHLVPVAQGGAVVSSITAIAGVVASISWGKVLVMTLVSVAVSYAINALFKPPEPPKPGKQISTKSYLLSSSKNRQAQGIVVPIGYGRLKVGSINVDAKNTNSRLDERTHSVKYVLESFTDVEYLDIISEGPIEGFVNQNGGAISEGDIRAGIFLNNVPIKSSVNGKDIFNYVLNERGILPEFKDGSASQSKVLSPEVSLLTEYNMGCFGPSPYQDGDVGKPKSEYVDISEALTQGAKMFSHASRNQYVSKFNVSLSAALTQSMDDGATIFNSIRFAITISRNGKSENILEVGRSRVLSIKINGQTFSTLEKIKNAINVAGSNSSAKSEWAQEGSTYLNCYTKIINLKSSWTNRNRTIDELAQEFLSQNEQSIFRKWHDSEHINPDTSTGIFFSNEESPVDTYIKSQNSDPGGLFIDPRGFFIVWGITSSCNFDVEFEFDPLENFDQMRGATVISVVKLSSEYDPSAKHKKKSGKNKKAPYYSCFDRPGSTLTNVGGIAAQRQLKIHTVQERILSPMLYPDTAMVKITFDSKNFKSIPNRTYHVKLKKVLIPSNYDPLSKTYKGPWDGLFKGQSVDAAGDLIGFDDPLSSISDKFKFWTDNPAWIFFDLVQNPRYGLGKYGLEQYNIDKWQLYQVAKYCDELVETRYPIETATHFPRSFVCNNIEHDDPEDGELGSFDVLIYKKSYFVDKANRVVSVDDYETLDEHQFIKEFGNGDSMRGAKIALFVYQHGGSGIFSLDEKEDFARKSAIRKGNVKIVERVIKSSDPSAKTVTLYGPNLLDNPATFYEEGYHYTVGACCAQISHPIVESRFTCNMYLNEKTEAIQAMNNIASVFRGLVGYSFGKIITLQDSEKNPIMLFNNSNVSREKGFIYSGTEKNKKFTAVLIRFNNKDKNFAPDMVYEEDSDGMRLFGYQQKEVMGLGITSETQARRLAKWFLMSSQVEVEQVSFTASEEASYLYPGCIIEVSDESRAGRNMSGRLLDVSKFNDGSDYFLIDKSARDLIAIDKVDITVNVGMPTITDLELNERAPHHKSSEDQDEEIRSIASPAPQIVKFQGVLNYNPSIEIKGPQGQSSIISELMVKLPFLVESDASKIRIYNHGLEDGDRVRFVSEGVLPLGLQKNRIGTFSYYVINSTEHTLQVSVDGINVLKILDAGRDNFDNIGGDHFLCIEKINNRGREITQSYINQVEIGSAYYIQGLYGSQVSGATSLPSNMNNLFIIKTLDKASSWYDTSIFGPVWFSGSKEWFYGQYMGWIYIGSMKDDRANVDEFFWFWWTGVGWVSTNESLHYNFWWSNSEEKWMYVERIGNDDDEISGGKVGIFFIYDDQHDYLSGQDIILAEGGEYKVLKVSTSPAGYWVISQSAYHMGLVDEFYNDSPPEETEVSLTNSDKSSNPAYHSSLISSVEFLSETSSLTKKDCIKIRLPEGHGLDLYRNRVIEISGFTSGSDSLNSIMNAKWSTAFVNDDEVELFDSESAASIIQSTNVSDSGSIFYTESIKNISLRHFQSQAFRVLSVKEMEYRKYEVVGLEYNKSKFESIDKNLPIKVPTVPIPPQADMRLPEPPQNLILSDLTS
jgi:predicted phage tail protein